MAPPLTVLKKRHSLKGKNLLELVKKVRGVSDPPPVWARFVAGKPLENNTLEELSANFQDLCGENLQTMLDICQRELNIANGRLLCHFAIILANEIGQPAGQTLVDEPQPSPSQKAGGEPAPQRLKLDDGAVTQQLLERIAQLENATALSSGDSTSKVGELKDKVRALCLQNTPSEQLILLTVDDLAKTSRRIGHDDAEVFEELSRQVVRQQGHLNIASFCLSVIGGKATDTISKALAKCVKEKQIEDQKQKDTDQKKKDQTSVSPLANLYPPIGAPFFPGMNIPQMYSPSMYQQYSQPGWIRPPRGGIQKAGSFRPKGVCMFCESSDHYVKDCQKMKEAKRKI